MSAISSACGCAQAQPVQDLRRREGAPDGGFSDAAFGDAAQAAGLDPSKVDGVREQINAAVKAALQESDGSGDKRAAVETAVNSVLKKNGVDPTEFKKQLHASTKKHKTNRRHHPPKAAAATEAGVLAPELNGDGAGFDAIA